MGVVGENNGCTFCNNQPLFIVSKCGHSYCSRCLQEWRNPPDQQEIQVCCDSCSLQLGHRFTKNSNISKNVPDLEAKSRHKSVEVLITYDGRGAPTSVKTSVIGYDNIDALIGESRNILDGCTEVDDGEKVVSRPVSRLSLEYKKHLEEMFEQSTRQMLTDAKVLLDQKDSDGGESVTRGDFAPGISTDRSVEIAQKGQDMVTQAYKAPPNHNEEDGDLEDGTDTDNISRGRSVTPRGQGPARISQSQSRTGVVAKNGGESSRENGSLETSNDFAYNPMPAAPSHHVGLEAGHMSDLLSALEQGQATDVMMPQESENNNVDASRQDHDQQHGGVHPFSQNGHSIHTNQDMMDSMGTSR